MRLRLVLALLLVAAVTGANHDLQRRLRMKGKAAGALQAKSVQGETSTSQAKDAKLEAFMKLQDMPTDETECGASHKCPKEQPFCCDHYFMMEPTCWPARAGTETGVTILTVKTATYEWNCPGEEAAGHNEEMNNYYRNTVQGQGNAVLDAEAARQDAMARAWEADDEACATSDGQYDTKLPTRKAEVAKWVAGSLNAGDHFDPRELTGDEKNCLFPSVAQGNCDSCWAFGASRMVSETACRKTKGKVVVWGSVEQLNSCANSASTSPCHGGTPEAAAEYIHQHGLGASAYYPYWSSSSEVVKDCFAKNKNMGKSKPAAGNTYDIPAIIKMTTGAFDTIATDAAPAEDYPRLTEGLKPRGKGKALLAAFTAKLTEIKAQLKKGPIMMNGNIAWSTSGGGHQVVIEGYGKDSASELYMVVTDSRDAADKYTPRLWYPDLGHYIGGGRDETLLPGALLYVDPSKLDVKPENKNDALCAKAAAGSVPMKESVCTAKPKKPKAPKKNKFGKKMKNQRNTPTKYQKARMQKFSKKQQKRANAVATGGKKGRF